MNSDSKTDLIYVALMDILFLHRYLQVDTLIKLINENEWVNIQQKIVYREIFLRLSQLRPRWDTFPFTLHYLKLG